MSYKPQGASLPPRFKKSQGENNFKQYPRSRLVVVDGYDLVNHTMSCTQVAPGFRDDGRKFEIRINPEKAALQTRSGVKYNGNCIDERMAAVIPVGARCTLEATKVDKKVKTGNGEVSHATANWIRSVPSQDPSKSLHGWFAVSSYNNRITGVQMVDPKYRQAIRPSDADGEIKLRELGEELDRMAAEYAEGKRPVSFGVCFRTMVKIGEKQRDGKTVPVYQVVDCSPPFDWEAEETDGEGNVIKRGSPLTYKFVEDNLMGYLDYALGSEDQSSPNAEPGLVATNVISPDQKPIVEVEVYRSMSASRLSERLDISNERSPLYSLATVMTKCSQNDTEGYLGKNWMVEGVVVLTEDKRPEAKGGDWQDRNMVVDLLVDGPRANAHTIYEAADGGFVEVHPALDRVIEARQDRQPSPERGGAPSQSEPAPALTAAAMEHFDDTAIGQSFFEQSVAEAAAAASTPEPAAAPPAETPAPEAEASKPAASRWQRRG